MRNLTDLLLRYLDDTISEQEMKQLIEHLQQGQSQEELQSAIDQALIDDRFKDRADISKADAIFNNILRSATRTKSSGHLVSMQPKRNLFTWPRVAAAVIVTVFIGAVATLMLNRPTKTDISQHKPSIITQPAAFLRYLVLPDSSTVILQASTTLEYAPAFTSSTREVKLIGEAYFDIRKDTRPFIIHTANVKTTVLGTAFNVKALPGSGEVTVSVARGKVKVEDKKKLLAVLLPNQQIVYSSVTETTTQKEVNTKKIITDWTTQDMIFESVTMASIAETLSKRYGVNVIINNAALKECQVNISFSGTEALKDVLTALCTITGASFVEESEAQIVITGEGCQ